MILRAASAALICVVIFGSEASRAADGDYDTPLIGGKGGDSYRWRCPDHTYLAGVRVRVGHDLDAIAPVCRKLLSDGSVMQPTDLPWSGGGGGERKDSVCPADAPFVRNMRIAAQGAGTYIVDGVTFECGPVSGPIRPTVPGRTAFTAWGGHHQEGIPNFLGARYRHEVTRVACNPGTTYAGLKVRAGRYVDALGAICGPIVPAPPVLAMVVAPPVPTSATATVRDKEPLATTTTDATATRPGTTLYERTTATAAANAGPTVVGPAGNNVVLDRMPESVQANQILCRGGEGLLIETQQHAGEGGVTTKLFFAPSQYPATADGSGLGPASCGFVDRKWDMTEPPGIVASGRGAEAGETLRIATYLRNPEHYWSFIVEKEPGMFIASRHGQWKGDRSQVTAAPARARVDCTRSEPKVARVTHAIEPRLERIRCEQQNLDGTRSQALGQRLDGIIQWIQEGK